LQARQRYSRMRGPGALISPMVFCCLPFLAAAQADPSQRQELAASQRSYENRIEALARSNGPLAFELAEKWVALGFLQRESRDYQAAVDSFETALHIERVHKGLHHPDQILLIERIIESNRALGAWSEVAQNHKLLQFVNERGRTGSNPARVATLRKIALWNLEAADLPTGRAPFQHLQTAQELTDEALEMVDSEREDSALTLVEILNLKAAIAFRIAHHMMNWIGEPIHGVTPDTIVSTTSYDASDLIFRQNLVISNYSEGRAALDRAKAIAYETNDKAAQARAEQNMGDWYLLFDRRIAASEHYATAQRLSQEANIVLFDRSRRLPNFIDSADSRPESAPSGGHVNYVRTRFDIDRHGRARNVEILEVNPQSKSGLARQARQQLRETRFRPRYEHGKAVESKGVEIRFLFPQAGAERRAEGATL
jgi:tetratricopeptide (TPR) repeat protein